ncbi:MAG TPA: two-component regulator propeller domain-containing protein [Steroidobacteraceae bacterium]|nr:two-component regulator propeller domain-containing protein [Steroidobacteraceae bacterium]
MPVTRGKIRSFADFARVAFALTCALLSSVAFATPPLSVQRYSLEEGLSQQAVNAIVQDSEGFMWFGTEDGLNRFDGYEFRQLRHERGNTHTLPNGWISSLVASEDGLWIATDGGGVVFRNAQTGQLEEPALLRDAPDLQRVRMLARDRLGRLWIASRDAGVAIYDARSGELKRIQHSVTETRSLSDNAVHSILHLRSGDTLVGTASGLDRFSAANLDISRIALPPELSPQGQPVRVRALTESPDGMVWVGSDAGLGRYDPRAERWRVFRENSANTNALPDNRVQALLIDSQGRLWVGLIHGLSWFDSSTETFSSYHRDDAEIRSLPDDYIVSLFEDRGGSLWIGTKSGGLAKWNPRTWSFGHFRASAEEGFTDRNITSFAEDRLGRLWIGTFGSGINLLNRNTGKVTPVRHAAARGSLSDDRVMAMLEGSEGEVWVGTMGGGLNRFDPRTLKSDVYQHDPGVPTSLAAPGVMSLLEVDKQLWVGTFGGGISRFDARTRRFENLRPGPEDGLHLSSGRVTALARDRGGHVWIGTDGGGLNVWDQKTRRLYYYKRDANQLDSLSADSIYSILVDDGGGVWIGTRGGGLDRVLDPADGPAHLRFANISEAQGLPNNTVYGLRADGAGNIWISTNFGLARLDPRSIGPQNPAIQRFHRLHGLQAEEFNFGAHYRDRSGKLFFGGAAGFNSFYPEVLEFNERPPRVVLTQFLKLNSPGVAGVPEERIERLSLSHKEDVITLQFAALDFADPRANRYEYKLEGFDDDWVRADERRAATYTNLPGGKYVFRVRASNSDGVWSTQDLALPVDVSPSPWASPWAYLAYALVAVLMLLAVWYAQQRRIARAAGQRLELEQQVSDRTYELAERNRELEEANRKLEMASFTDTLTGLANRRYLMEHFPRLLEKRDSQGLAIMIIDLDALKPINDQHGHAAGDEVIVEIAKTLQQAIRPDDVLVRWGGDEFVVVAQARHVEHATMLAERIRERVAKMKCVLPRGAVVRTSCSIGLTCLPFVPGQPDAVSWEHAIKIADLALYRAKRGRNAWRGWFGTELVASLQSVISAVESNVDGLIANGVIIEQSSTRGGDDTVNALRVLREAR